MGGIALQGRRRRTHNSLCAGRALPFAQPLLPGSLRLYRRGRCGLGVFSRTSGAGGGHGFLASSTSPLSPALFLRCRRSAVFPLGRGSREVSGAIAGQDLLAAVETVGGASVADTPASATPRRREGGQAAEPSQPSRAEPLAGGRGAREPPSPAWFMPCPGRARGWAENFGEVAEGDPFAKELRLPPALPLFLEESGSIWRGKSVSASFCAWRGCYFSSGRQAGKEVPCLVSWKALTGSLSLSLLPPSRMAWI